MTEIEKLEKELEELKESNRSAWETYGSELCAGGMIQEEKNLQEKIDLLKHELEFPQKCKYCGVSINLEFPNAKGDDDGWRHIEGDKFYRHCKEVTLDYKQCINFNVHAEPNN